MVPRAAAATFRSFASAARSAMSHVTRIAPVVVASSIRLAIASEKPTTRAPPRPPPTPRRKRATRLQRRVASPVFPAPLDRSSSRRAHERHDDQSTDRASHRERRARSRRAGRARRCSFGPLKISRRRLVERLLLGELATKGVHLPPRARARGGDIARSGVVDADMTRATPGDDRWAPVAGDFARARSTPAAYKTTKRARSAPCPSSVRISRVVVVMRSTLAGFRDQSVSRALEHEAWRARP